MNKIYLRFSSGSGHYLSGEVGLNFGESKILEIAKINERLLKVEKDKILLPFYYDAEISPKTQVLKVTYNILNNLEILALTDNIRRYSNTLRAPLAFWKSKNYYEDELLEKKEYKIPVSNKRTTNGVIINYNGFSIQPISALEDPRLNDDQRYFIKEGKTSF